MGKITDNKLRIIQVPLDINDVNLHSQLVDFKLEKFEVAKIEEIEWWVDGVGQIVEASATSELQGAVVNDPDDVTTIEYPDNELEHDVIDTFYFKLTHIQNVVLSHTPYYKHVDFDEDEDVYCLRNARVNWQCSTTKVGVEGHCVIKFRRETLNKTDYINIVEEI